MKLILNFMLIGLLLSCATTTDKQDPLKYSKKLIKQGHVSLYNNGAFAIGNTSMTVIPPGPDALDLVAELTGLRAKQSFLLSLKHAKESVYLVADGTRLSYTIAKNTRESTQHLVETIQHYARSTSKLLIYRSANATKNIVGEAWEFSHETAERINQLGQDIDEYSHAKGGNLHESGTQQGVELIRDSMAVSRRIAVNSIDSARNSFSRANNKFVYGYAALPQNAIRRAQTIANVQNFDRFKTAVKESNDMRSEYSDELLDVITDTSSGYTARIKTSIENAANAYEDIDNSGITFATLKALRWVMQALLWDGVVSPVFSIGSASVGYVAVNTVAFPVLLTVKEGLAVTNLAIEITKSGVGLGYDIVAPTGRAALAGSLGLLKLTGGFLGATTVATGGAILGVGEIGVSQVSGRSFQAGGYVLGKGIQYLGIPIALAGINTSGVAVGVIAGGGSVVSGAGMAVAGEVGAVTTAIVGNTVAGSVLVGGTSVSVLAGGALGIYELSKAVVVPAGFELGGGIVLSYATLSHLAAHTILAVADASYVVLSLEGPRWVLYAVKGRADDGSQMPTGALIDLDKLQSSGEEFYVIPATEQETDAVVESVYQNLPSIVSEEDNI